MNKQTKENAAHLFSFLADRGRETVPILKELMPLVDTLDADQKGQVHLLSCLVHVIALSAILKVLCSDVEHLTAEVATMRMELSRFGRSGGQ